MAENRNEGNRGPQKGGGTWERVHKREQERERERASDADKLRQDNARDDRDPGNFQNSNKDSQR